MKAFLGTALGKVIVGVLAAAVVTGGGFAVYQAVKPEAEPVAGVTEAAEENIAEINITTEAETTTATSTEAPTTTKPTTVEKPADNVMIITGICSWPQDMIGQKVTLEFIKQGDHWVYEGPSRTSEAWTLASGFEYRSTDSDYGTPITKTGTFYRGIRSGDTIYEID